MIATLNSPICEGGEISMEIISMGHISFLVMVDLMWVQDPGFSWRFPTNTLNISFRTKVAQTKIITHTNILEKWLLAAMITFYWKFSVSWELI